MCFFWKFFSVQETQYLEWKVLWEDTFLSLIDSTCSLYHIHLSKDRVNKPERPEIDKKKTPFFMDRN